MTDDRWMPEDIPERDFRAPDLSDAVEGWRAWGVHANLRRYDTPKLYSVTYTQTYWKPRVRAQAFCRKCGNNVPGENCTCGFYSAKTLAHLMSMTYHQYDAEAQGMFHVVGQVANWGKVIEGSQGWRSQFSYPIALYVPYEAWTLCKRLTQTYGVPTRLKNILVPTRREAI